MATMLNHHPHPSYHSHSHSTTASPLPPAALHRKPIPSTAHIAPPRDSYSHLSAPGTSNRHSRTRTSSSSVFPSTTITSGNGTPYTPPPQPAALQTQFPPQQPTMQSQSQYPGSYQAYAPGSTMPSTIGTRRTLSNATSSTNSTASNPPTRSPSAALQRSSSTTSSSALPPTSYVALMRKQKATVWCDRSQSEDPRILAAQRAAKARALMEVAGGPGHAAASARAASSGSGVAAGVRKIRHGGAHKAMVYVSPATTGNLVTQTVPMRLSASEVDEGDSEEEGQHTGTMSGAGGGYHHRTGSGRSSVGSGRRVAYGGQLAGTRHTPPHIATGAQLQPANYVAEPSSLEDPHHVQAQPQQYPPNSKSNTLLSSGSRSSGSSSLERGFGEVAPIPQLQVPEEKSKKEDLVRRGSVDERTMTLGGARSRLFIANPDLSD